MKITEIKFARKKEDQARHHDYIKNHADTTMKELSDALAAIYAAEQARQDGKEQVQLLNAKLRELAKIEERIRKQALPIAAAAVEQARKAELSMPADDDITGITCIRLKIGSSKGSIYVYLTQDLPLPGVEEATRWNGGTRICVNYRTTDDPDYPAEPQGKFPRFATVGPDYQTPGSQVIADIEAEITRLLKDLIPKDDQPTPESQPQPDKVPALAVDGQETRDEEPNEIPDAEQPEVRTGSYSAYDGFALAYPMSNTELRHEVEAEFLTNRSDTLGLGLDFLRVIDRGRIFDDASFDGIFAAIEGSIYDAELLLAFARLVDSLELQRAAERIYRLAALRSRDGSWPEMCRTHFMAGLEGSEKAVTGIVAVERHHEAEALAIELVAHQATHPLTEPLSKVEPTKSEGLLENMFAELRPQPASDSSAWFPGLVETVAAHFLNAVAMKESLRFEESHKISLEFGRRGKNIGEPGTAGSVILRLGIARGLERIARAISPESHPPKKPILDAYQTAASQSAGSEWYSDANIAYLRARKRYGNRPRALRRAWSSLEVEELDLKGHVFTVRKQRYAYLKNTERVEEAENLYNALRSLRGVRS